MGQKILVIGLGNPGDKYKWTRHNVGFLIVDRLSERLKLKFSKNYDSYITETEVTGNTVYIMKPQTYMNSSGKSLHQFLLQNSVDKVVIIFDDYDLPIGKIRIRIGGKTTHNGVKSIIETLEREQFKHLKDFIRLRIGIGKGPMLADYVLDNFTKAELKEIQDTVFDRTVDCILELPTKEIDKVMNVYNG